MTKTAATVITLALTLPVVAQNDPVHVGPDGQGGVVVPTRQIVHPAGQSVEWRNTALITHSVTDDSSVAADPKDASVPQGATAFNSGDISAGETYSQTFTAPGTYKYFCTHHEGMGMLGTVIVDPAS